MAAIDFNAIASAIATRFSANNITPPSGETDIRLSTHQLPASIAVEPTVLVMPPDPDGIEFGFGASTRIGTAVYPVNFYLYRIRDNARNVTLALKWLSSLYAQMEGQVHLGLDTYVTHADVTSLGIARLTYGGEEFDGVAMEVTVSLWEALSPTA